MMKRRDRFRFWLMRIDEDRRVFRYVDIDMKTFSEATLYCDVACAMLGGHFAIYDQEDDRIAHDSRKLNGKAGANAGE